jgi:hypothetical protein
MSRISSRNLIIPISTVEEQPLINNKTCSLPQTNHRLIVDYPLRNSAIAAVKKQFSRTHPELAERFEKHFSQMYKLKPYGLMEVKLKEYNMTIVFNTLKNNLEEMTYTVDNLDFKPCAELARKSMFSWLAKLSGKA